MCRQKRGLLFRLVSAFTLSFFLPAAAVAAPYRYCLGKNGHRGIEFVHTKDRAHSNSTVHEGLSEHQKTVVDLHVGGPYCEDILLLPVVAKFEKRDPGQTWKCLAVGADARFRLIVKYQRHSHSIPPAFASFQHRSDPRLAELRTIVLRN